VTKKSFESLCEEFIKINSKLNELKKVEESLKLSLLEGRESLRGVIYQNDTNSINFEYSDDKVQNIKDIRKGFNKLDANIFDESLTVSKSKAKKYIISNWSDELQKDMIKKVNAIIDLNSEVVGETRRIVVRPVKE